LEDRYNTKQVLSYIQISENMFPKMELLEDTKGGGKEEKNDTE
jgi:hypothetical protein